MIDPKLKQYLGSAIGKILQKDPVSKASNVANIAGFGAGLANAATNDSDNSGAITGGLMGAGLGAGTGTRIGVLRDIVDNTTRESNLRSMTGMKSAVPKFVRDPKRMALYAALGLLGGGMVGGGIGSLFDGE
jgi:hypothetical protein